MKSRARALLFALLMAAWPDLCAATESTEGWTVPPPAEDRMSDAERAAIWAQIDSASKRLALPKAGARPAFRWPLRAARGYANPAFARVSNYVDHDAAAPGQLRDFNCGTRTYDRDTGYNHQGTDIGLATDGWNLMAAGQVEIVAAAPGTILQRIDGNFDRNCSFNTTQWNAVYVEHDDGSVAWYGHMKNGSVTPKTIGQRVVAGEYLGLVGSSGNSTGPHLHFEVYDAARRLIDPYAGTCNLKNAESWWESQPVYNATQVMALTVSSAPPTPLVCGSDGRLQDPGNYHAKSAFAPGETAWLVANMRDMPANSQLTYVLRDPSGAVVSQTLGTAVAQPTPISTRWAGLTLPATAPAGHWMAEVRLGEASAQLPFTVTASGAGIPNYTDLWWSPAEPGWGMNLNHQGDTIFATWFTYDADGAGQWLVMSSGARQPDGSFAGTLYRATGVPFSQIDGAPAASLPLPVVGSATVRFADAERATFTYTLNGVSQAKSLQRQRFGAAPACMQTRGPRTHATNYQDLWWNPAESGWGVNLTHQGDTIFATWFTYGAGGRGMWLVASDVRRQATGEFRGRLYRTAGIAFDRIAGAPAIVGTPTDVGELALDFTDGEHGRFAYTLDGVTQSRSIERQVFAASTPLCR